MKTVLFVIPSLNYGGAARQLSLLAAGLVSTGLRPRVCVLGGPAPWVGDLRAAGVEVDVLGRRGPMDLGPFRSLSRLVRQTGPAVVHAWGLAALRALTVVGLPPGRLLVSAMHRAGRAPDWLDHWLLRRAGGAIAFGPSEAGFYRDLGIPAGRVFETAPGVALPAGDATAADPEPMPGGPRVLGVGPFERHKGFGDAVWARDILGYLYDDLRLVLVGSGPDLGRLRDFARGIGATARVDFVAPTPDLGPLLRAARVVWAPSLRRGGIHAALEAMAAGRPVVATRVPGLAEVVVEGQTGFLVEPGDKAALARQTRLLLDDPALARRLGAAARQRVAERFPLPALVRRCVSLYAEAGAAVQSRFPA